MGKLYNFTPVLKTSECYEIIKLILLDTPCEIIALHLGIQEYPGVENIPPKSEMVKNPLKIENGYIIVPDSPGIGIELADDVEKRFPYKPRAVKTRLHVDCSVVDQ